ncbi:MAG: DUF1572 family protein [Planctomycetota bacterium]
MYDLPISDVSREYHFLAGDLLDQAMKKICHCLDQLNDRQVWWRPAPNMNSIGNLLLHLSGNLNQWGVVPFTLENDRRDREVEFSSDIFIPKDELLEQMQNVVERAKDQWQHLEESQLLRRLEIQGFDVSHMHAILHASSHFVGHTHQVILLTRLQLGTQYQFHWSPGEPRGEVPI